jgi:hypothetical protein
VNQRWEAIHEAAEYISWCLDNPELSFSEHGLLYNESEGGMKMASMYCDLPCYLGLLAYAEMADAAQRPETAQRWRKLAKRLFDAMEKYYPAEISPWGEVWDPHKTADWNYKQGILSPLVLGMDYYGYDIAHKLPTGWLERTERSYKMQSLNNKPEHAAPAGFGYGQGYITQASLALDRMHDAPQRIDWMAKLCFAPHLPHPYRVPEGLIVNGDGTMWRRWGDLGNLYQLNEVLYTVHLIVGIDDLDHDTLKIMPRLPFHWQTMEVKQWPVRTISMGKSEIAMLDLTLQKAEKGAFLVVISADKPIDSAKMRMGPFNPDSKDVQVKTDQQTKRVPVKTIGDSKWCWLDIKLKKTDTGFIFSAIVSSDAEQGDLQ